LVGLVGTAYYVHVLTLVYFIFSVVLGRVVLSQLFYQMFYWYPHWKPADAGVDWWVRQM